MPRIAQLRNPRLIAALKQDLRRSGADIRENVAIRGFVGEEGKLQGLLTSVGEVSAHHCLLAAGAWTAGLLEGLGLALPIEPVRGQMLLFRCRPGLLRHILLREYQYLIPRRDGRVLVGSTLERVGFDRATTPAAEKELRAAALAWPVLSKSLKNTWSLVPYLASPACVEICSWKESALRTLIPSPSSRSPSNISR